MMKNRLREIIILIFTVLVASNLLAETHAGKITEYTIDFYDTARARLIPLAVYCPEAGTQESGVVIFSHGYDKNAGGSYKAYSYLTRTLAENGYFVISIQHELPGDDLLAMEGNLYLNRLPNWERGVENILFTVNEFKKIRPELNWSELALIGHSNGGDMTMLFATIYPGLIWKAISMDHRRMPMPRTDRPGICSLRGFDYQADEGVIPTADERKKYSIQIVKFEDIAHSDMDNKGNSSQHERLCQCILKFLKD